MSAINDLVSRISDSDLRSKIEQEITKLTKQKKFGLVFEEHLPECTPLFDVNIKSGMNVALKEGRINDIYKVISIKNDICKCVKNVEDKKIIEDIDINKLVAVASFGEPIYPYLKPIDKICNNPESNLWHTLIEADNYHALQLLEYLYYGKVDCIYIDPPYNTGAHDWKYNNNYVDATDEYRSSKWLSMMKKRLEIAKNLLNPKDSVLIVTIDEKEYLHLGCLLEEMFKDAHIQMIVDVINPKGVARKSEFSRVNEYIYYVFIGDSFPVDVNDNMLDNENDNTNNENEEENDVGEDFKGTTWLSMRRAGTNSKRIDRPNLFYPIYINSSTGKIIRCGEPVNSDIHINFENKKINNEIAIYPIKPKDNSEGRWQLQASTVMTGVSEGWVKAEYSKQKQKWIIKYLNEGTRNEIDTGELIITGKGVNGELIVERSANKLAVAKSVWNRKSHNATTHGTNLINDILCSKRFDFPKSLYSEKDALYFILRDKKEALIVDFFAGSGTTLHAVNLLNKEDNGNRRCIIVTNNEVSEIEKKKLAEQGYEQGDAEFEKLGIAKYVTWLRTICSIKGENVKGEKLKGNYLGSDFPMSDGFKSNANYFKLGFLDKTQVALGKQLANLIPVLWLKSGAYGECPAFDRIDEKMLILDDNKFAVLINENCAKSFYNKVIKNKNIETLYIITDSERSYKNIIIDYPNHNTYQLYKDYLDNFRINVRR